MMQTPDWLDQAAIDLAKQAEAAEAADLSAEQAREQWLFKEQERRNALPRTAETVSLNGAARLAFGCGEDGTLFLSLVVSGYEAETPIVRVTHWMDDGLPNRAPWYSAPADLELRAYIDRAVYVEQFLKTASGGGMVSLQVETFPEAVFSAPDRLKVVAPILENCLELTSNVELPADLAAMGEEITQE